MKPYSLLLAMFVFLACINLSAQDILIMRNGDEVKVKVKEIGENEIKYSKFENLNGPIYSIKKSDVFMIRYENGSKDVFTNTNTSSSPVIPSSKAPAEAEKSKINSDNLSKRSIGKALFLSAIAPGCGQLYAKKKTKGFIMAGTFVGATALFVLSENYWDYYTIYNGSYYDTYYDGPYWPTEKYVGLAAMSAVWLWSVIDAPITAARVNRKFGLSRFKISPDSYWLSGINNTSPQPVFGARIKVRL